MQADLIEARRVINSELAGLHQLQASLGDTFVQAVDIFHSVKGRIIVTGMGKSGHIARKIAATLASTGTPAYFVHPGEASHGDLGMITPEDSVIAISNSGETQELANIIEYAKRYHIPLVAMTNEVTSTLGKHADICLEIPKVPEACPNQLAPTTSTTMMLALGDALALCLFKRKGFTKEDYKNFHPGGTLGNLLRSVGDVMFRGNKIPLVSEDTLMPEVITIMTSKSLGCAGVTDKMGVLIGIITDGDLRRHLSNDILSQQAKDIMTPSPYTSQAEALVQEAVQIMNEKNVTSLFILDASHKPLGIIHMHQCLYWT